MKRVVIGLVSALLLVGLVAGCSAPHQPSEKNEAPQQRERKHSESQPEQPKKLVEPELVPAKDTEVQPFSIRINGMSMNDVGLSEVSLYEMAVSTTNSKGNERSFVVEGYKLKDVLKTVGLTGDYIWLEATATDGYTIQLSGDIVMADSTLLAVTRDGEPFSEGPWLAPGGSQKTQDHAKNVKEILVSVQDSRPDIDAAGPTGNAKPDQAPSSVPEIIDVTKEQEFAPFAFKVNNKILTNKDLKGYNIYEIETFYSRKGGDSRVATFTGYQLTDVLDAAGITDFTTVTAHSADGYFHVFDKKQAESEHTLLAIERDGKTGEGDTVWVAPTRETLATMYPRLVVELEVE